RLRERMRCRLGDVGLERLARELAVILIYRMARTSVPQPKRTRILLEGLGESLAGDVVLAGHVGDQSAVVALIELGPVGIAQAVERGERIVGLSTGALHPSASKCRGEVGDRALARRGEMLVGPLIVTLLECLAAE